MDKKAIISMSGGLDSTSLAIYLLSQGYQVKAYTFKYGQKHSIEIRKAQQCVKYLQKQNLPITIQVINLKDVFNESVSSLNSKNDEKVPEGDYRDETMKSTVVENRNVIFSSIIYSKALSWSKQTDSEVIISLGIHAGDHCIYPDTTEESQQKAKELFRISNWGSEKVDYITPFVNITKDEVLKIGIESCKILNIDWQKVYKNTISCYTPNNQGHSCGKCGTCVERLEAFEKLGLKDPIEYVK